METFPSLKYFEFECVGLEWNRMWWKRYWTGDGTQGSFELQEMTTEDGLAIRMHFDYIDTPLDPFLTTQVDARRLHF